MRLTNLVLAASAAGLASAYPRSREVVPKRSADVKKRSSGFTCMLILHRAKGNQKLITCRGWCQ